MVFDVKGYGFLVLMRGIDFVKFMFCWLKSITKLIVFYYLVFMYFYVQNCI